MFDGDVDGRGGGDDNVYGGYGDGDGQLNV